MGAVLGGDDDEDEDASDDPMSYEPAPKRSRKEIVDDEDEEALALRLLGRG